MKKTSLHKASVLLSAAAAAAAGVTNLSKNNTILENLNRLGYPSYLASLLGTWELLGAMALVGPAPPKLREWAYAGFTFTYTGAFVSHLAKGEKKESLAPLLSLALLISAYRTRPEAKLLINGSGQSDIVPSPSIKRA